MAQVKKPTAAQRRVLEAMLLDGASLHWLGTLYAKDDARRVHSHVFNALVDRKWVEENDNYYTLTDLGRAAIRKE